jgi:hypothetical protein
LPPGILRTIQADEVKLAGMEAPSGLNPSTEAAIQEAIGEAFVFGFRMVMLICAGLSVASAALVWRVIPKGTRGFLPKNAAAGGRYAEFLMDDLDSERR